MLLPMLLQREAAHDDSIRSILLAEFENVIMAHGENVFGNGKQRLIAALQERGVSLRSDRH